MKKSAVQKHEKQAAMLTLLTVFILFLWLFFHKAFSYQDPPEEYGMEVNFGVTDTGSQNTQPVKEIKMDPIPVVPEEVVEEIPKEVVEEIIEEEIIEEEIIEEVTPEEVVEDVITEDTVEDVPVIVPKEEPKEEVKEEVKEIPKEVPVVKEVPEIIKPIQETPKETPKETPVPPAPVPDQATENALASVLNGPETDGETSESEGDDNEAGDKGNDNGDPNAPEYYTNPGNGSGGDYNLIGRIPLRRPVPAYLCRKEGRVVVAIKVDRNGKVIEAIAGAKGSTTTESCLLEQAKKAALKTKWQAAANAPEKQVGKIIYNFRLY